MPIKKAPHSACGAIPNTSSHSSDGPYDRGLAYHEDWTPRALPTGGRRQPNAPQPVPVGSGLIGMSEHSESFCEGFCYEVNEVMS